MRRSKRLVTAGIPVSPKTPLFPSAIVSRRPDRAGMSYGMVFQPRVVGAPTVPYAQRSSLGQPISKYRLQNSSYISQFRLGLQALIGYPAARGQMIINTAPPLSRNPRPVTSGRAAARPGVMRPNPRFKKALPYPVVPFNPPVYGGS